MHISALLPGLGCFMVLAGISKEEQRYYYPAALAGIAVAFGAVLFLFLPDIYNLLVSNFISFFGQAVVTTTVQEARGWSTDLAWFAFNYGLLLFVGGALVMAYNNFREEHPHQVFALVWSVVMFYSTWQHIRYEYYLAINIALLSAVCVYFVMNLGWADVVRLAAGISSDPGSNQSQ